LDNFWRLNDFLALERCGVARVWQPVKCGPAAPGRLAALPILDSRCSQLRQNRPVSFAPAKCGKRSRKFFWHFRRIVSLRSCGIHLAERWLMET
jgi:hypothetical protein